MLRSLPISKDVLYRPVLGFPGYAVGTDGSVWSSLRGGAWKPLKLIPNPKGYLTVRLRRKPGVHLRRSVHALVLEAFIGPRPKGAVTRHFPDRDPTNNRLENLQWGTPTENRQDMKFHGTHQAGEASPTSKLTEAQVREIHGKVQSGAYETAVASQYGLSQSQVSRICHGQNLATSRTPCSRSESPEHCKRGAPREAKEKTHFRSGRGNPVAVRGW